MVGLDANVNGSLLGRSIQSYNSIQFSEFLNPKLRRLLSNSLVQPNFSYACISWYPLVGQKIRKKIQVTQKKYIHFCLKLSSRQHLGAKEFRRDKLATNKRKSRTVRRDKCF